jgi:tetratricopeptide (TPR) repeat protein
MSSVSFKDLRIIINQLSKQEISSARKFLVAFDTDGHKSNNKNLRLLEFLLSRPEANYSEARKLEGDPADKKSFDQVCRRLKEKIGESLILDVNIRRSDFPETCQSRKLAIRKKLLIASVFMERGATNEALSICHKIIGMAKEYELYSEVHEALYWISNEPSLMDSGAIEALMKDLEFYRYCDKALYRARELYCTCTADRSSSVQEVSHRQVLAHARGELALMFQNTRSATIAYYYYLVEIRFNFVMRNFVACCDTGIRLIQLVSSHPVLRTEIRLGSAFVELANAYNHLGDDQQSLFYSRNALDLLPETSSYYELAKETEFKSLYNLDRKEEASISLKKLIDLSDRKKQPWVYWKRLFYMACLNFSLANYPDTMKAMERIGKLKTENEGWNIGRRILTILCKIEMNAFDDADKNIESLRKYLQRNVNARQTEIYYKNVTRALIQLSNKSYVFDDISNIMAGEFNRKPGQRDEHVTPDVKLFAVWFNTKLEVNASKSKIAMPCATGLDSVA